MGLTLNKQVFVVLLAAAYLFVALTYIVCLKRTEHQVSRVSFKYNSIFKRQNADGLSSPKLVLLKRADKSIPKEHHDPQQLIVKYAQLFLVLFHIEHIVLSHSLTAKPETIHASPVLPLLGCLRI